MANPQNIKNHNLKDRTKEERIAIAKMGGQASVKAKAERKTLKQELLALLSMTKQGVNNQERLSLALLERAYKGDVRAFEVIRDTIGEKEPEKTEIMDVTPRERVVIEINEDKR